MNDESNESDLHYEWRVFTDLNTWLCDGERSARLVAEYNNKVSPGKRATVQSRLVGDWKDVPEMELVNVFDSVGRRINDGRMIKKVTKNLSGVTRILLSNDEEWMPGDMIAVIKEATP